MRPSRLFGSIFLSGILFVTLGSEHASAQWRLATQRDTVVVAANKLPPTSSKITLTSGVEVWLQATGTFTFPIVRGSFDAGYTFAHQNWTIPPQLKNPPTYGNVKYDYGLRTVASLGLIEDWFKPFEAYNASHFYTSRITSAGNPIAFYIKGPNNTYNQSATGSLTVKLARWTAGIAVKTKSVSFGSIRLGQTRTILDSIASYGLDPLIIQNIEIIGPDSLEFSFVSQRDKSFTLPTEQANEIKIIYAPTRQGLAKATLRITCKNSDLTSREQLIDLSGTGIEPIVDCIADTIEFGKVRIGTAALGQTIVCNRGTADLIISSAAYSQSTPTGPIAFTKISPVKIPDTTISGSTHVIKTQFAPTVRKPYIGKLVLTTNVTSGKKDTVILIGDGAEPVPVFSRKQLNFGSVYRGDQASDTFSIKNIGNWTAQVVSTYIDGDQVFSFEPDESSFILESDSTRFYTVYFHPATTINRNFHAWQIFIYDDGKRDSVELMGTEIQPPISLSTRICDFGKMKIGASKDTIVTYLTNEYNATVTFEEQLLTPQNGPFSVMTVPPIEAKKTVPLPGNFTPRVVGPAQAWVYLKAGKRDSILLVGEGAVAKAVFDPPVINFGTVPSDTARIASSILTDSGNYRLRVIRYEITGPNKDEFRVLTPVTIPAGRTPIPVFTINENQSITIDVEFKTTARAGRVHNAVLCLYYDDGTSDCIQLQAIEEAQYLQFGAASIDFGIVRVGSSKKLGVPFKNNSNIPLSVKNVRETAATDVFKVVDTPRVVLPGQTMEVMVEFTPTKRDTFVGYVKASEGDFLRVDSIQLHGIGGAPEAKFSPQTVNFGSVQLFASKTEPVTLFNIGNWDLSTLSIDIRSDNYGEFSSSMEGLDIVIAPDSSLSFSVTFTPTQTIVNHSADLVFTLDDSTVGIVHLIGLDESPNLVLFDSLLDFKRVRLGTSKIEKAYIVNTTTKSLTADTLYIMPDPSVFSSPSAPGRVTVPPNLSGSLYPVDVTVTPTVRGPVMAKLIIGGGDAVPDTTLLLAEGAEPIPQFDPPAVLDFGTVLYGTSLTRTFTIKNIGNWEYQNVKVSIGGPNAADFTQNIFPSFFIEPDSTNTFSVTFLAASPLDLLADRSATLTFTIDDNTVFTYELLARDREPYKTDLKFDNTAARIGDIVYPSLRLMNSVPDSLKVDKLHGVVLYDQTVVKLLEVNHGTVVRNWTLTPANDINATPGRYEYTLEGNGEWLSQPGSLLRFTFKALETNQPGAYSDLKHDQFEYPLRKEVQASLTNGVIVIDSTCGSTHLAAGTPTANYIEQNSPNPADLSDGGTVLHFQIGADGVPVTIRIVDVTGNEVARPIDGVEFSQGNYQLRVDASMIPASGTYFCEFRAGADKPMMRKMILGK